MSDADVQHVPVTLVGLWVYPVKSCAGVELVQARVTPHGLAGDREWVLVGEDSALLWQGELPRMALVRPELTASRLVLAADGAGSIDTSRFDEGEPCTVKFWNEFAKSFDAFAGSHCDREADRWLTDLLGRRVSLVRLGEAALRRATLQPVHVMTQASMDALRTALPPEGQRTAQAQRFRPNVLLSAATDDMEAFDEESWAAIRFGPADARVSLRMTQPCVRCVMPNVDPLTAEVGQQPLATVTTLSMARVPGAPVRFGMYAHAEEPGHLVRGAAGHAEIRF